MVTSSAVHSPVGKARRWRREAQRRPSPRSKPAQTGRNRMRTPTQLAASAFARLPPGACRRLLEGLPPERAFDVLQVAGRKCNVSDIRVVGDYGPIEGSIEDSAIMRAYAVTRSWRPIENRFFAELFT